jgi:hypothetical protein
MCAASNRGARADLKVFKVSNRMSLDHCFQEEEHTLPNCGIGADLEADSLRFCPLDKPSEKQGATPGPISASRKPSAFLYACTFRADLEMYPKFQIGS